MILRSILAGALLCVLFIPAANAQPPHHIPDAGEMVGCSDPVMRPCGQVIGKPSSVYRQRNKIRHLWLPSTRANSAQVGKTMPPGLSRVMAEGAGRAVNWIKPRAWCGWFMRRELGVANPAANLARWWAGFGRPAHGPQVGAIVVWRHHVGRITGRTADGRWIVKSGNDGHRVRERPRSVAGAIAFRWPA
jgi:hypothetical protein